MSPHLRKALQALAKPDSLKLLAQINRGIEKESLRISKEGKLAQTPHPGALGSALTHSSITTDYSEALLEFITPVRQSIEDSLGHLEDIHTYVYQQLENEILWCASMPCIVAGDDSIPVAEYGDSNVARMKTVYRYGLGHRYGRLMQTIAGVHYNWSMPQAYWQQAWQESDQKSSLPQYITDRYLGLIRNFRRYSWLLIYLFGASPAVCSTFLKGREDHGLESFDEKSRSLYLPQGTSLRMGGLGYNSDAQKDLSICYNSLENYIETLRCAIMQPHPEYANIPAGQNGDYQQLSDSLLQIENEFYSPIRPKRVANSGETALNALVRGGIEYIEVRCVDVSPFSPVGLDEQQIRFLDTFLMFCLIQESPACDEMEQAEHDQNLEAVVNRGRQKDLKLLRDRSEITLADWADELLDDIGSVAALFDQATGETQYSAAVTAQSHKISDPELTPSARVLREMREQELPFFRLAMAYSERWAEYFRNRELPTEISQAFEAETLRSLSAHDEIGSSETLSFQQYLDNYFAQYKELQKAG